MSNRIVRAIRAAQDRIDATPADKVRSLEQKLTLDFGEFCEYQRIQSEAAAAGVLSTDEAMVIYTALGGEHYAGGWPKETLLAARVIVVQTIGELLKRRISGKLVRR
jgi:hypothetical protein